jgi:hypothetical protein
MNGSQKIAAGSAVYVASTAAFLLAALVTGCGDATRTESQTKESPQEQSAIKIRSDSASAELDEPQREVKPEPIKPSQVLLGTWDFDPEAMRETEEYKQQIELIESGGLTRQAAVRRGERSFATLSSMHYVFTERTFSVGWQNETVAAVPYQVVSEIEDIVVTETIESDKPGQHQTIRVVDADHIIISDDSRPDIPVWTFKRRTAEQ